MNSLHCTLFSVYSVQYKSVQYKINCVRSTVYNLKYIVYNAQCNKYNVYCSMYSVQYIIYNVQCTMYSIQYTMYSIQLIIHSVQCTVYICKCPVYSVHCTVYIAHTVEMSPGPYSGRSSEGFGSRGTFTKIYWDCITRDSQNCHKVICINLAYWAYWWRVCYQWGLPSLVVTFWKSVTVYSSNVICKSLHLSWI